MRRGEKQENDLLIVVNFSPLVYEKHRIGVPYNGKFKEIFNSDSTEFGGEGNTNPRARSSKKNVCDDRENSIEILVPPMGISVFQCTEVKETARKATVKKAAAGKTAVKKTTAPKKTAAKTTNAAAERESVKEDRAKDQKKRTAGKKVSEKKDVKKRN